MKATTQLSCVAEVSGSVVSLLLTIPVNLSPQNSCCLSIYAQREASANIEAGKTNILTVRGCYSEGVDVKASLSLLISTQSPP